MPPSTNTAAAAAVTAASKPPSNKRKASAPPPAAVSAKQPKVTTGFDAVSAVLTNAFHAATRPTKCTKPVRMLEQYFKALRSNFEDSRQGRKPTNNETAALPSVTPADLRLTRSIAAHKSPHLPTPVRFPLLDDSPSSDVEDIHHLTRRDQVFVPISVSLRGVKRLSIQNVLRLCSKEECVIFVPPHNKNDDNSWRTCADDVLNQMKRIILAPYLKSTTKEDRDLAWEQHLKQREVKRDGSVGYEFHVRVSSFAERDKLSIDDIPQGLLQYLTDPSTGCGIKFNLIGYGSAYQCFVKFYTIPFIEFYQPIQSGECVIGNLAFTKSTKDDVVCNELHKRLNETKGDITATANTMIAYYQNQLSIKSSSQRNETKKRKADDYDSIGELLSDELKFELLESFVIKIDQHYRSMYSNTCLFG